MPSIIIKDNDNTTTLSAVNNEYAVFIPGFSSRASGSTGLPTTATQYNSLSAFRTAVGDSPATWGSANNKDKSYILASELLGAGLPVIYKIIPLAEGQSLATMSEEDICARIGAMSLDELKDKGTFDLEFVTTGGYPTLYYITSGQTTSLTGDNSAKLTGICTARGDCFAVITTPGEFSIKQTTDVPATMPVSQDAFCMVPDGTVTPTNTTGNTGNVILPGAFQYLRDFAISIKSNVPWLAIAGLTRGVCNVSSVTNYITNAEADALQPSTGGKCINAITYMKPTGYVIWGNRTLAANATGLTASSFINVRLMVHYLKKQLYKIARGSMFEPNSDVLWVNFRNQIAAILDQVQSGQGIESYRITRLVSSATGTVSAKISIVPIEAVESFDLNIMLDDSGVTVSE